MFAEFPNKLRISLFSSSLFPFCKGSYVWLKICKLLFEHQLKVFNVAHLLWGILTATLHWDQIKPTIGKWLCIKVNVAQSCLNRMGWQCRELTAWSQQMLLYITVQSWKCGQLKDYQSRDLASYLTSVTNLQSNVRANSLFLCALSPSISKNGMITILVFVI